jgi:hypothetical protein
MEHGLYVVSVGVECERCVVARMVAALAGLTVIVTAGGECRLMKGLDLVVSIGLECQVDARAGAIRAIDPEFISGEVVGAFANGTLFTQGSEYGPIEALAGRKVLHAQVNVVDESAKVELHGNAPSEA